jgi:hypothetical protein
MSQNREQAIQDGVRKLTDEQQQEVMDFVEALRHRGTEQNPRRYSFVGIAHSGKGSLSSEIETLLDEAVDRREGWSLR